MPAVTTWADATATWADATATWAYSGVTDLSFKCEASPTTDPGDTPVWVDITSLVRSGRVTRGRQSEFDRTSAGKLTLTVDNRARLFDPTVSGFARVNKRIRVSVGSAPDTVVVFDGWIDSIPQSYRGPGDAVTELTVTDGFKVLANYELDEIYGSVVEGDSPYLWWRFMDDLPLSTVCADASGNNRDGTYKGTPTLGECLVIDSPGGSVQMDSVSEQASGESFSSDGVVTTFTLSSAPLTLECWIRTGHYGANSSFIAGQTHTVSSSSFSVDFGFTIDNSTGRPSFSALVGGITATVTSSTDIRDTGVHHLVGTVDSSRVVRFYLDGVLVGSSTAGSTTSVDSTGSIRLGKPPVDFTGSGYTWGYRPFKGEASELAVYQSALSAGDVSEHYTAGSAAWANETTGARVTRILDLIGWPVGERSIDTGVSVLGAARNVAGSSALDHLLAVEQTEQGRFFIAGDGVATFFDRHHETTVTTQADIADGEPDGLEFEYSDANLINDCTVTREGGVPQRAQDAASIATYWRQSEVLTGLLYSSDSEALAMAQWRVQNFGNPVLRPSALRFKPLINLPTLYPRIVNRELGDRISVTKTPLTGADIEIDAVIEGITHEFAGGMHWVTSWNLSPLIYGVFGPGGGGGQTYWTLSGPGALNPSLSQLDSDNRLAF